MEPELNGRQHDELQELLGPFALGLTDDAESRAMREHLLTCARCQAELAEIAAAVDALPFAVAEMEPPPALRERIAAAVLAEPRTAPTAAPSPPPAPAPAPPATPAPALAAPVPLPVRWWSSARPWAVAAAALLLITLGLLFWNLRLQDELRGAAVETIALAPTDAAPGASGEIRYQPDLQLLIVDVRDLPPLAEGEVYEFWLIDQSGVPVPAGVVDQSTGTHAIAADRGQYQAVAITAEPGPLGTAAPTGDIVAQAAL